MNQKLTIDYFESVQSLDKNQVTNFMSAGLCYVKLPSHVKNNLLAIRDQATQFFRLPSEKKDPYQMENGNGYLDQSKEMNANIQRYIYRNSISSPNIQKVEDQILSVRNYLRDELFDPLFKQVASFINLQSCYRDFTRNVDQTISLIYYPADNQKDERIKGHKDLTTMTALWAPEAGLYSNINGRWVTAECDESHIAIQIGQALEVASDKQCQALEHRVELEPNRERFSLASFYGPDRDAPLKNYRTDEIVAEKFGDFVTQYLQETYQYKN
jgi:isopenicillin N synthase-like dioxygenase